MKHSEWMKKQIEEVVPRAVHKEHDIPVELVTITYTHYHFVPYTTLDDPDTYRRMVQTQKDVCRAARKDSTVQMQGIVVVHQHRHDSTDTLGWVQNHFLLWLFGWSVKVDWSVNQIDGPRNH